MENSSIVIRVPPQQSQLVDELTIAIGRTSPSEMSNWGKKAAKRFVSVGVKRVTGFGSLLAKVTTLSADELVRAISAWNSNSLSTYAQDRVEKAEQLASLVAQRGQSAFDLAAKSLESRPSEAATHLLALIVGFYCGSGGDGDGGIPDLDLLAGIGARRSIFTHSIVAGTFVETAVMSLVDLIQVVHTQLPEEHSVFWDGMLRHTEIGSSTFVSGASIGIATHLGVDTVWDGFTPYKDLPIHLPQFAHELLMGLNAGAEGLYGVRRYGEDFGQLVGNSHQPKSTHTEAVAGGDMERKDPNRELSELESKVAGAMEVSGSSALNDEFAPVVNLAERIKRWLGIDTLAVTEAIESARARISQSNGPFCLGVVGEFRVGKSTLLNALMGQEVAFTDFLEATSVICRFVNSPQLGATIHFNDGREDSMGVQECNSILDERRHDTEWASSVTVVEYQVPSETLDSFDLWDAPGLGGSEGNDLVAQHYVDMLGGAIWVVDATLVGKAAIATPIARMHADGKPIICVLNRIDETDEDPDSLKDWVAETYPGVFVDIVTFSAQDALDAATNGNPSRQSEDLLERIKEAIGDSADASNTKRAKLTAAAANNLIAAKLDDLRRDVQDRIGALNHFNAGLKEAKRETLCAVRNHLVQRAESVFAELKSRVEGELVKTNWSSRSITGIVSLLSDRKILSDISRRVAEESLTLANQTWMRISTESLALSAAAVPLNDLISNSSAHASIEARHEEAIQHGVYVGGMTAVAAGTLAAMSTIVTWPVILAAIPVGALAMWKKRNDLRESESELMTQVTDLISLMKHEYIQSAQPEIESRVETAIQQRIERCLADKRRVLLNAADPDTAALLCDEIRATRESLQGHEGVETRTEWTGSDILELLGNPGSRLDIVTHDLDFSLSPLLSELPATSGIRLIFNASDRSRDELEAQVAKAFENWSGRRRIKAVSAKEEIHLATMLMTQDRCLVSESSLGHLLENSTKFHEFEGGRLAGQHLFAGLWEGNPYKGVPIEAYPTH